MTAQEMGKFIARRRKELHMTQAELGEKVGVTDKAISRWERGVGFPDLGLFDALAQALEISSAELFAAKLNVEDSEWQCDEVAGGALDVFQEKSTEMRVYSLIALILSEITCLLGIVVICYYVNDFKLRGLLVGSLILTGVFVSATNGAIFRAGKGHRQKLKNLR